MNEDKMEEKWVVIKGFPQYEISSLGNIRIIDTGVYVKSSLQRRHLVSAIKTPDTGEYTTKNISSLIAKNFLNRDITKSQTILYRDGNPRNCSVDNIKIVEREGNINRRANTSIDSNYVRVILTLEELDMLNKISHKEYRTPTGEIRRLIAAEYNRLFPDRDNS